MNPVVVVGSVNVDLSAQVERIPAPGETVLATGFARSPGGKGGNQAVAAARAGGAEVALVGAVGTDDAGAWLTGRLAAAGVSTSTLVELEGPSGQALISVDAAGENAIVVVPGANAALTRLTEAQADVVRNAVVVLAQLEVPLSTATQAARLARASRAMFILNAAPSQPLSASFLADVDVLIVNEHEARDVAGTDDLDSAMARLSEQVATVVLTLGAAGSRILTRGQEPLEVPAVRVKAVDTTAAGDTYCGVLAAALARGAGLAEAALEAAAASALTVTRPGAQDSIPERAEVLALVENLS
jgi:ribokinase